MKRLDMLVVELGLARSRSQAQALVKAGAIEIRTGKGFEVVTRPSYKLTADLAPGDVRLRDSDLTRYVSRGGIKMRLALEHLGLDPTGFHILDVGISTGGFSDCLLQNGAQSVTGLDVGHGQLHEKLKSNPRVSSYEGINARNLDLAKLGCREKFDLIVVDVSFISLTLVLPSVVDALAPDGKILALVKPQFELDAAFLNRKGIVKDQRAPSDKQAATSSYLLVRQKIESTWASLKLNVMDFFACGIEGGDGNQEYFIYGGAAARGLRAPGNQK